MTTTPQRYYADCRALVAGQGSALTSAEAAEVIHLIEHGEPAEGLRTLAWIIGERDKQVPAWAIARLKDLIEGLIEPDHLPPDLGAHGLQGP